MRHYACHKTVEASVIHAVNLRLNGARSLILDAGTIEVSAEWVEKHQPQVGGYFVQYADGYQSYSPAKAFEEGYRPLSSLPTVAPHIEKNFTYHPPKPGQPEKYQALREKAKELAALIDNTVPKSREQSLALTNLEQAVFWANAGIARNS